MRCLFAILQLCGVRHAFQPDTCGEVRLGSLTYFIRLKCHVFSETQPGTHLVANDDSVAAQRGLETRRSARYRQCTVDDRSSRAVGERVLAAADKPATPGSWGPWTGPSRCIPFLTVSASDASDQRRTGATLECPVLARFRVIMAKRGRTRQNGPAITCADLESVETYCDVRDNGVRK